MFLNKMFSPKRLLKQNPWKIAPLKLNIKYVWPLELLKWLKWTYHSRCLWEAAIQECSQKMIVLRNSHRDIFFNIAIQNLWSNSLKSARDGAQFLVNLHVTLSCFWPLVQNSYILSHHFAKKLLLWNTSWKLLLCSKTMAGNSREKFGIIR